MVKVRISKLSNSDFNVVVAWRQKINIDNQIGVWKDIPDPPPGCLGLVILETEGVDVN